MIFPVFLKSSLVFPIILFPSIFLQCSLKGFLFLLAILWNSALSWHIFPFLLCLSLLYFSQAICKASSDNHFAFLHFFFGGCFWSLPPVQCYKPLSIVVQDIAVFETCQCLPKFVNQSSLLFPFRNILSNAGEWADIITSMIKICLYLKYYLFLNFGGWTFVSS